MDLVRQEIVKSAKSIVVKVGSNVLTAEDGTLDRAHLAHLTEQIAEIKASGREVALVSSGSIAAGIGRLGLPKRPTSLPELQAAAAVGQAELIDAYEATLRPRGFHAAQVLLTADDFDDRGRYLNTRNTLLQLFRWNAIPIINENDTVSVEEIRFGDNDRLAAMVTNLLRAPLLIILSVVDGLYPTAEAAEQGGAPIDKIMQLDESIFAMAGTSTSGLGTGGMTTKLEAARLATSSGESVWIAGGRRPNVLRDMLNAEPIGTVIPARGGTLAARKRWIGHTVRPRGTFIVDEGAEMAVAQRGASLLSVGVVEIRGRFEKGDVVAIEGPSGRSFARGLTNYSSEEARKIVRMPSDRLAEPLSTARYDAVIHRDNLVIL
ncbi:glutamate 5-kinase [Planctomycetes bacterium Pan216]